MKRGLTLEQRAWVIGEEGICPECEQEVRWADIDSEWYICEQCIYDIVHAGEADRARLNNDLYVHARQREDASDNLGSSVRGNEVRP